jgi:hypothetical protein
MGPEAEPAFPRTTTQPEAAEQITVNVGYIIDAHPATSTTVRAEESFKPNGRWLNLLRVSHWIGGVAEGHPPLGGGELNYIWARIGTIKVRESVMMRPYYRDSYGR